VSDKNNAALIQFVPYSKDLRMQVKNNNIAICTGNLKTALFLPMAIQTSQHSTSFSKRRSENVVDSILCNTGSCIIRTASLVSAPTALYKTTTVPSDLGTAICPLSNESLHLMLYP